VQEFLRLRDHGELSDKEAMKQWEVLAPILHEYGWTRDAMQLTEEVVVKLQKSKLGHDHPDTLSSMYNLAIEYSAVGRQVEALQLTEEVVVKLQKSKLMEDHLDTLSSMHSLVNRYSQAGRRAEALQLAEDVVELRKNKLREDHPDTLLWMHNQAIQYSDVGRRVEALQLVEEVVKPQKSKFGVDHPLTITSERLLAQLSQGAETSSTSEASHRLRYSRLKFQHRLRSGRNK
jgi:tetratricopeptide (TPR) repeat protein